MEDRETKEVLEPDETAGGNSDDEEGYKPSRDEETMIEEGKAAAILGYVPFLCFIPLIKMRENPFAFRHGKQGLFLFFIEVLAVFFMFDIISNLFWGMLLILAVGSAVFGILYAIQGKDFTVPFIGETADRLKI